MNNLKDIHNPCTLHAHSSQVVILGFQWTIWRIYTTKNHDIILHYCCYIRISMNNLKDIHNSFHRILCVCFVVILGFQWTIWRIYTTFAHFTAQSLSCYIRISMNNLKDIHNTGRWLMRSVDVVILGFQWTIWRIYTT